MYKTIKNQDSGFYSSKKIKIFIFISSLQLYRIKRNFFIKILIYNDDIVYYINYNKNLFIEIFTLIIFTADFCM